MRVSLFDHLEHLPLAVDDEGPALDRNRSEATLDPELSGHLAVAVGQQREAKRVPL